jgi:hypothetical protein
MHLVLHAMEVSSYWSSSCCVGTVDVFHQLVGVDYLVLNGYLFVSFLLSHVSSSSMM